MITGTYFNTFSFNGTLLNAQPSDHHWIPKEPIGVDGSGIEVMPAVREYEMKWDFLDTEEWQQIYSFFLAQGVTGSIVSSLPLWNGSPYQFYAYSGTILREPTFENFFQNYYQSARLVIVKILT